MGRGVPVGIEPQQGDLLGGVLGNGHLDGACDEDQFFPWIARPQHRLFDIGERTASADLFSFGTAQPQQVGAGWPCQLTSTRSGSVMPANVSKR